MATKAQTKTTVKKPAAAARPVSDIGRELYNTAERNMLVWFARPVNVYAALMMAYETGLFKSAMAKANKNYTGIKFIGQPGAVKGSPSPEGNNYAKFVSNEAWANDFKRILSMNKGAGRPIDAKTLQDFVHRLKVNKYFGVSEAQYLRGLQSIYSKYWPAGQQQEIVHQSAVKSQSQAAADSYKELAQQYKDRQFNLFNFQDIKPLTWVALGVGLYALTR